MVDETGADIADIFMHQSLRLAMAFTSCMPLPTTELYSTVLRKIKLVQEDPAHPSFARENSDHGGSRHRTTH